MDYLLGIDLGTSSCKTVLFDRDLKVVSLASVEYPTLFPHHGWAEQPADQWWQALIRTVQEVLDRSKIDPADIAGIGVDSMGSVVLPVDCQGQPLRNGLIWMDRRSEDRCCWIDRHLKDTLWQINGNYNDPSNIAPKVLWIKDDEPGIYEQTGKFLHANGYLVYKLTGQMSMDVSEGGLTQLFDLRQGCWSPELIAGCGIDRDKFPEIYNCYDVVGKVTADAASASGLKAGTPVVAGAMDMVASALGSGVNRPGQVYTAAGTVTAVGACTDRPEFHHALHIYHHIVPGMWIKAAGVDFGGGGLRWFKDLLREESYDEFNDSANQSPPGSNGLIFLPYMVGQRAPLWNSNTRGVIFGLNPASDKRDLVRMMMEGNALGVRYILNIVESTGLPVSSMRMTGGCTRSSAWMQIFADITGKKVEVPGSIDVAALGSAITAGVGAGVYGNFQDILTKLSVENEYQVNPENTRLYESIMKIYCKLYQDLQDEFDMLAEIQ
jgi:xylulokinase